MSQTTYSGTKIGGYHVLAELGAGGMGLVLKAFDEKLERTVALKFLAEDGEQTSLLREARAASVLDHKNIVAIHAIEQAEDGRPFLVMAYCEGESLAGRLRGGRLPVPEAVDIAEQVGEGLAHAHAHNIVHRDIKASNIILTGEGVAKIVDFGLARQVSADASTQTMGFAGTLSYMAPEQLTGGAVDGRTDIWSLGVLLYEMLTGRLPFDRDSPVAGVAAIARAAPTPMPEVPRELQLIVYRALAKQPQDRYQSAAELVHDLRALGSEHADVTTEVEYRARLATRAPAPPPERVHWNALAAWGLVAAFVLAWVIFVPPLQRWLKKATGGATAAQAANPAAHEAYLRGMQYLDRWDKPGNLDAAVQEFQSTTKSDPNFALAFAGLCETHWMEYRYDSKPAQLQAAEAACERAAALNGKLPAVNVALGKIHNGTGKRELALQEFERALQLDPRDAPAWIGLGDTYMALERNEEAESAFRRAIALRPEHWSGYYRLGAFYFMQQRYAEAADRFRKVVELAPDHGLGHASLGQMLMALGRYREAEPELQLGATLARSYGSYTNLGVFYFRQRRWAESAAMTELALQVNDRDYRVWDNLALAYTWMGEKEKARRASERSLALLLQDVATKPDDGGIRASLALTYAQRNERAKAQSHMDAALALAPHDPDVMVRVGESYIDLGERAKGVSYIEAAVAKGFPIGDLEGDPGLRSILADPKLRHRLENAKPAGGTETGAK